MTVMDAAGNFHTEVFNVVVASVDDAPVLNEFPALVQIEHALETTIPFAWSDVDSASTSMTITANRSGWTSTWIRRPLRLQHQHQDTPRLC